MQLQSFTARMPLLSVLMTTSTFGLGSGADAGVLLNGVIYVSVLYYKADTSQVITNKLLQYWQQKAASLLPPTK